MNLKIGCSGFPSTRREYFKKFKVVEVQRTFVRPPSIELASSWRRHAPEGFEFTVKAWNLITGDTETLRERSPVKSSNRKNYGFFQPTDEVFKAWEKTKRIAAVLQSKIIVFQSPPSFTSSENNQKNMLKFFRSLKREEYLFVWDSGGSWEERHVRDICSKAQLVHCDDPFLGRASDGSIRYMRMGGIDGRNRRYKGLDLKRLRDFCENEAERDPEFPMYAIFNNRFKMSDALRFEWIAVNTGRTKEINLAFFQDLCGEIEYAEEDEKVQLLSREAERIVTLILHTDYARVDIEIEKSKLREMCKQLFPDKEQLYEMVYSHRFDRLWEQFREDQTQGGEGK